jgi:hypothetical protein
MESCAPTLPALRLAAVGHCATRDGERLHRGAEGPPRGVRINAKHFEKPKELYLKFYLRLCHLVVCRVMPSNKVSNLQRRKDVIGTDFPSSPPAIEALLCYASSTRDGEKSGNRGERSVYNVAVRTARPSTTNTSRNLE